MSEESKEEIKQESGSRYVEREGVIENVVGIKPLYYDAVYDPNPWPVKDNDLLRRLSMNDKFVDNNSGKIDYNKIKEDYLEYHQ